MLTQSVGTDGDTLHAVGERSRRRVLQGIGDEDEWRCHDGWVAAWKEGLGDVRLLDRSGTQLSRRDLRGEIVRVVLDDEGLWVATHHKLRHLELPSLGTAALIKDMKLTPTWRLFARAAPFVVAYEDRGIAWVDLERQFRFATGVHPPKSRGFVAASRSWLGIVGPRADQVSFRLHLPQVETIEVADELFSMRVRPDGMGYAGLSTDAFLLYSSTGEPAGRIELEGTCFDLNRRGDHVIYVPGHRTADEELDQVGVPYMPQGDGELLLGRAGEIRRIPVASASEDMVSVILDDSGRYVAFIDDRVRVWTWDGGSEPILDVQPQSPFQSGAFCGEVDPQLVLTAGEYAMELPLPGFSYPGNARSQLATWRPGDTAIQYLRAPANVMGMRPACVDPLGEWLFASETGDIWRVMDGGPVRYAEDLHRSMIEAMAVSPSGDLVASYGEMDWTVHVWRAGTELPLRTLQIDPYNNTPDLAFRDDDTLVIAHGPGLSYVWTLGITPRDQVLEASAAWTNWRIDGDDEPVPVLPFPEDPSPWLPGTGPISRSGEGR